MRSTIGFTALLLGVFATFIGGPVAQAFIPKADRTIRAIAKVNRSSGRNRALQLELTMRVGDHEPIARGQLITHPSGLARLELRGFNGRIDRYLLSGRELLGAKDGKRLDQPQPLLQPLFFLQPSTETTLRTALESFGVLSDSIGLATCGDEDCFVIGDPRLAAPLPEPELNPALSLLNEDDVLADPLAEEGVGYELATTAERRLVGPGGGVIGDRSGSLEETIELEGPELQVPQDALLTRLWVDIESLQVRRIDRASGVFTIFGPIVSFDKLRVPAWFEVHEPNAEPIRFVVDRAVQVNAPPQAFSRKWLFAPTGAQPADSPGPNPPNPAATAPADARVGATRSQPGRPLSTP